MDQDTVLRYSRHLIMPEIGIGGQKALLSSSVLVVGAGGLGCPVIQYLTASGVGTIGIVDYDVVDMSNLHRQILHTEVSAKQQVQKASSAAQAVASINSKTKFVEYHFQLNNKNALDVIMDYDVIVDATDNVPSRYLISDICVIADKPLVSGSALRWEGQLTVYHYKPVNEEKYGPCYRCLYPNPPPPETVTNCSDGGVLGVVPGIIGSMQALETIKIIIGVGPSYHKKLLVFDGLSSTFRNIKLRDGQPNCVACGTNPSINKHCIPDYERFCNMAAGDKCLTLQILPLERRLSVLEYNKLYVESESPHVLVDVRQPVELEICQLPNSVNLPIKTLELCQAQLLQMRNFGESSGKKLPLSDARFQLLSSAIDKLEIKKHASLPIVVVCKQGNDSQKAVEILTQCVEFSDNNVEIKDIIGGLMSWAAKVDSTFLRY